MTYRPNEVATRLGIATVTLRAWSNEFAAFLSDSARKNVSVDGRALQRRYTDSDIVILHQAKVLLDSGNTYDETRRALASTDITPNVSPESLEQAAQLLAALKAEQDARLAERDSRIAEKDETIAALQAHIETLQQQIDELRKPKTIWDRLLGR